MSCVFPGFGCFETTFRHTKPTLNALFIERGKREYADSLLNSHDAMKDLLDLIPSNPYEGSQSREGCGSFIASVFDHDQVGDRGAEGQCIQTSPLFLGNDNLSLIHI